MRGVNRVILVGNVGKDPEVRYLPSGGAVTNLTLATTESWTDKATGQKQEATDWHRVTFYGKLAEIVGEYVRKGSKLYVEGSMHTRKWQDKATGQDKYQTEVKASQMQMLDGKQDDKSYVDEQRQRQPPAPQAGGFEDDERIPF